MNQVGNEVIFESPVSLDKFIDIPDDNNVLSANETWKFKCTNLPASDSVETGIFGIILPIICLFGLLGNVVNLAVFLKGRIMNAPPLAYFTALSFVHAWALIGQAATLVGFHFFLDSEPFSQAKVYFFWPLCSYMSTLSTFLVAASTVDGYLYIGTYQAPSPMLIARKQKQSKIVIISISIFVLVINFPKMLAYTYNPKRNCFQPRFAIAPESWFTVYITCQLFLQILILLLTAIFQCLLIRMLCRNSDNMLLSKLPRRPSTTSLEVLRSRDGKLILTLIVMVTFSVAIELVIFIFSPVMISFWTRTFDYAPAATPLVLKSVTFLAVIEYSSIFVFMLICNSTFRQKIVETASSCIHCKKRNQRHVGRRQQQTVRFNLDTDGITLVVGEEKELQKVTEIEGTTPQNGGGEITIT